MTILKDPNKNAIDCFRQRMRDLEWLQTHTVTSYRTARGTRPDLRVVEWEGSLIAIKDYNNSSLFFKYIVGWILIRREYGAMCKLLGVRGVPKIICKIDAYSMAMEHIPHKNLKTLQPNELDNDFYENLRQSVDAIHQRGIAHCDMRTFGNVMAGEDGMPYIVDFAACVFKGRGINPFTSWLFKQFVEADRYAVLKVKKRFSPELLTPEETQELNTPLPLERCAKAVGHTIRRIVKKISAASQK